MTFRSSAVLILVLFACGTLQAQNRLFVPDFHLGGGTDTQLLIGNKSDQDATVDIWAFVKAGQLLGQAQVRVKGHSAKSTTMQELFGKSSVENTGWLAATTESAGIEMTYALNGTNVRSTARDARGRSGIDDSLVMSPGDKVIRISNASSTVNVVTMRKTDAAGTIVGIQELSVPPFAQLEVPVSDAARVDISGSSHFVAESGASHEPPNTTTTPPADDSIDVVIGSETPVGAYQMLLSFDPELFQVAADGVQGGTSKGFDTRPLAVAIDNHRGLIRLAAFQVGNEPVGDVHVASVHVQRLKPGPLHFSMKVEEITDLKGDSILAASPTVRLVRGQ